MGIQDKMSIHIVTHAYAAKLPQYAVFLRVQLSSLLLCKCDVPVRITVCYNPADCRTVEVLEDFRYIHAGAKRMNPSYPGVTLIPLPLDVASLFRRCIGRDLAVKGMEDDIFWLTDVDYFFGADCLNSLWATWNKELSNLPVLLWPKQVRIHKDHDTGEEFWRHNQWARNVLLPDLSQFVYKSYARAIGGVQIVNGEYIREHGYLRGNRRWQRPRTDDKPFGDFQDDIAFRRTCTYHGAIHAIEISNVFRMRHREVTYRMAY